MARRRSEGNMFLDSQESANIFGNEKQNMPEIKEEIVDKQPVKAAGDGVKSQKKAEKTPAADNLSAAAGKASQASVSDVLSILSSSREIKQNGLAKSIYLDKDVHDKVLALSKQSGVPFSKVINMLLRAAFRETES